MALTEKQKELIRIAMGSEDEGNALIAKLEVAAVESIATTDAVDAATTQAMANECKAKINEILAALKASTLMAE